MKIYKVNQIAELNKRSLSSRDCPRFINYLDTSSLTKNRIFSTQFLESNFPSRAKRKVKNNTILFSTVRPDQEHYGILEDLQIENLIVSTGFTTIDIISKDIAPKYLFYLLTQPSIIQYLQGIAENSVSAYPSIKPEEIGELKFRFPDILTQQKIAKVLSDLDAKIDLNNRINSELEAMAKLVYEYWFVLFDFSIVTSSGVEKPYKSSGGKMVWNEELKREIPEGWEVKCLHEIANIKMGQSPEGSTYNEEGKGLIFFQGSTDFGWRFPENRVYTTAPTRFASKGDILLSVRAPIGTMNIALVDCCIGRGLAALNSKDGFSSFLIYQMTFFKQKFDYLNSVGTTFGSLTKDDLYNLQLVYPPKEILKKFEDKVTSFDKKIENNTLENQQLSSLRDWLLPMLINGQVSVDEVEERVEEELGMVAEPEREEYKSHQS